MSPPRKRRRRGGSDDGRIRCRSADEYSYLVRLAFSLRQARGHKPPVTQAALARALSVSQTLVSAWERGAARPPQHQLRQIAQVLGVTLDDLVPPATSELHRSDRDFSEQFVLHSLAVNAYAHAQSMNMRPVLASSLIEQLPTRARAGSQRPARVTDSHSVVADRAEDAWRFSAVLEAARQLVRTRLPLSAADAGFLYDAWAVPGRPSIRSLRELDARVREFDLLAARDDPAAERRLTGWIRAAVLDGSASVKLAVLNALEQAHEEASIGRDPVAKLVLLLGRKT